MEYCSPLDPGSRRFCHSHPGSAIVEVVSGTVEVEFVGLDGSRTKTTLEAGDGVIFRAIVLEAERLCH